MRKQYSRPFSFQYCSFTYGAVTVAAVMPLHCRSLICGRAYVSMQNSAQKVASAYLLLLFFFRYLIQSIFQLLKSLDLIVALVLYSWVERLMYMLMRTLRIKRKGKRCLC